MFWSYENELRRPLYLRKEEDPYITDYVAKIQITNEILDKISKREFDFIDIEIKKQAIEKSKEKINSDFE